MGESLFSFTCWRGCRGFGEVGLGGFFPACSLTVCYTFIQTVFEISGTEFLPVLAVKYGVCIYVKKLSHRFNSLSYPDAVE